MKTSITFAIFIFATLMTTAQNQMADLSAENTILPFASENSYLTSEESAEEIAVLHSQLFVQQLTTHLAENVVYPEILQEYAIEGKVWVKVTLDKNGAVVRTKIMESPTNALSKEVLKAVDSFGKVQIPHANYRGHQAIKVPVDFSL